MSLPLIVMKMEMLGCNARVIVRLDELMKRSEYIEEMQIQLRDLLVLPDCSHQITDSDYHTLRYVCICGRLEQLRPVRNGMKLSELHLGLHWIKL